MRRNVSLPVFIVVALSIGLASALATVLILDGGSEPGPRDSPNLAATATATPTAQVTGVPSVTATVEPAATPPPGPAAATPQPTPTAALPKPSSPTATPAPPTPTPLPAAPTRAATPGRLQDAKLVEPPDKATFFPPPGSTSATVTVTFRWQPVPGAEYYKLTVLSQSDSSLQDAQTTGTSQSMTLRRGETFFWAVHSCRKSGAAGDPANPCSVDLSDIWAVFVR